MVDDCEVCGGRKDYDETHGQIEIGDVKLVRRDCFDNLLNRVKDLESDVRKFIDFIDDEFPTWTQGRI